MTTEAAEAVAGIGDNVPPSAAEALHERLAEVYVNQTNRRDDLLAAVSRIPETVGDEETAGKVSDFIKQLAAAVKNAESYRVDEKEPHLASGRIVDGYFKQITEPLKKAKATVEAVLNVYLRKKADEERHRREEVERLAREEAKRLAAKAAEAEAAIDSTAALEEAVVAEERAADAAEEARNAQQEAVAKAADMSRTRGDYGAVASLRTTWDFEIEDESAIPLAVLWPFVSTDAKEKAIRAFIRAGNRELSGVRIFETTSTVVR